MSVIAEFGVPLLNVEDKAFPTVADQWESNGRILVTLEQRDPTVEDKVDTILLDKADILRLADILGGH